MDASFSKKKAPAGCVELFLEVCVAYIYVCTCDLQFCQNSKTDMAGTGDDNIETDESNETKVS